MCSAACAQTNNQEDSESINYDSHEIYPILIPIDAKGSVLDGDLYLPEQLHHLLLEHQGDKNNDGARCVIRSAQYNISLPSGPTVFKQLQNCSIALQIESFVSHCHLHLPLKKSQANWDSSQHRLNGSPTQLRWLPDGNGCMVDLDSSGKFRLILSCQIKISPS